MNELPLNPDASDSEDSAEVRLFEQALDIPEAASRRKFLEASCEHDPQLLARVLELLSAHESETSIALRTWRSPLEPGAGDDPDPLCELVGPTTDEICVKYRILKRIGEGGCGTVYLAQQELPVRRQVALKVIKPGMDSRQVLARFELERQTLAILDHPNIARILDAGTSSTGRPYFVMEYVQGERFTDYCDQNRLGIPQRLQLFIDVCLAVQHAHQKGVIHRDLKPSNILVAVKDGVGIPKVIDFGIAKAIENSSPEATLHTELHQLLGTPAYMSPEQAQGGGAWIDTRSDIYSLGVLLYELITGETPFNAREISGLGFDAIRKAVLEVEPLRPSRRLSENPPLRLGSLAAERSTSAARLLQEARRDLDWIVMKALEKDRARRYPTANGLASDLRRHLSNEAVEARPPSASYRFQKTYQRNRTWMLAGGVTCLAVILALILTVGMYRREVQSRREADHLLARSEVEGGWLKWNTGDVRGAMASFAKALELDALDPRREQVHRIRLAAVGLSQPELAFSWSVGGVITAAAFRHDGRRVLLAGDSAGQRGVARVWDVDQGRPVSAPMNQLATIHIAHFSTDGRAVLTASRDGRLRIWDAASGNPLTDFLELGQGIDFAELSPDAALVFAGSSSGRDNANGVFQLWEVGTGRSRRKESIPGASLATASFSPDGKWIACGSQTFVAMLLPTDGSEDVGIPDCWRALAVDFSPDGRRLLVTGAFGANGDRIGTRVLDVASRTYMGSTSPHITEARAARFAPDGRWFASGGGDQVIQVAQLDSVQPPEQGLVNHATVEQLAFSPDSRLVAATCADHCVRTWHVVSGIQFMSALPHPASVLHTSFSDDGREIRTISADGSVNAWVVRNAFPSDIEYRQQPAVDAIHTGEGEGLLVADEKGVTVLDAENGKLVRHYDQVTHGTWRQIEEVEDGFLMTSDEGIHRIDQKTGVVKLERPGYAGQANRILTYDHGRKAFRGYVARKEAVAFDVHTGRDVQRFEAPGPLTALAMTPDEHQLVGFGPMNEVYIWDSNTSRLVSSGNRRGLIGEASHLQFTPDGQYLLASMGGGLATELYPFDRLLSTDDPVVLGGGVSTSVFSADGRFIASGDAIGIISIRRTEDPRRSQTWRGHRRHVVFVEMSPDNLLLFTSSRDGTSSVWDTHTGLMVVPPILRENTYGPSAYDASHGKFWVATAPGHLRAWSLAPDRRPLRELQREYGASSVSGNWDPGESWRLYRAAAPRVASSAH